MLSPIIDKHVYEGAHIVRVTCIEAGATVTLRSSGNELPKGQALGGELIIDVGRPLEKDEELTAVAQVGPQSSNPSAPVKVLPAPQPLPFPLTETTLYIGGTGIGAWGALPGSTVQVVSGAEELGERLATNGQPIIGFGRPLTGADAVQLQARLGQQMSPLTKAITPVQPQGSGPYAEKLPPPDVKPKLYACQRGRRPERHAAWRADASLCPGQERACPRAGGL